MTYKNKHTGRIVSEQVYNDMHFGSKTDFEPTKNLTVGDMINKLSQYPKDAPVNIFDWRRNEAAGEESTEGIYEEIEIDLMKDDDPETNPDGLKPWVAIMFSNDTDFTTL